MQDDRRRVPRVLVGMVAGAMLLIGAEAPAQQRAIDPVEFRERLMTWAVASEQTFGPGLRLAEKLAALSDEQVVMWLSTFEDPDAFLRSTERVVRRLQEPGPTPGAEEAPTPIEPLSATNLTTPFPPDYPPGSGPYKNVIIDGIADFGISGASNTNRCDASDWGDYVAVWWPLNKVFDELDGACVVAGCDPTGVACAIACGILETAKIALKVAAVPLEACDVHQGAIDGAEIEATYENTLGLVGDVSHVHDDLADHDTAISTQLSTHHTAISSQIAVHDVDLKTRLAAHDTDIKALLGNIQGTVDENQRLIKIFMSRQLDIMRLLITPDGRREINADVLTCTGDDCPVFPGTQLCPNGSLKWNCKR